MLADMEEITPQQALARADELATQSAHASKWLARYYVIFGLSSVVMAVGFGLLKGPVWAITLSLAWLALIVAISRYAARQPAMIRGGGRLHGAVMVAWTVCWVATVGIGSTAEVGWWWWLGGGMSLLVVSLIGAWTVLRRTESR